MRAMFTNIRLWTAITLIGVCAFSVAWGLSIVHFSLAAVNAGQIWAAVPGLASKSLQSGLTDGINLSDLNAVERRRKTLSSILSVKPLSSSDWLAFSGMQLAADQPMEQVLESLELSVVTGPNEAHVMAQRGIFAVSLWEDLSKHLKSHAARDLAPIIFPRTPAEGAEAGKFATVLATKSEFVRNELRNALVATGLSSKEVHERLGL
jgi:hypothetical protein